MVAHPPVARIVVEIGSTQAPTVAATAVYGGIAPNGNLIADFVVERPKPPTRQVSETSPQGIREVERAPSAPPRGQLEYIRDTQVRIVFRAEDARSIGNWFLQQAGIIEQATAAMMAQMRSKGTQQ